MTTELEHANITVTDARKTADLFCRLFDWNIRWEGGSIHEGYSVHVGSANSYVALYSNDDNTAIKNAATSQPESYYRLLGLNHIAVTVDDIDAMESRVKAEGFEAHSHADYEPGRRFYFHDHDGLEIEVVSYLDV
ncbi:MAG: catechol 2,3-dioxygenase-like lactoylglutathione lyase family enzyme [Paracoccaceae bacterium]|jgi:catechol 2,3-dioxygenase-like lactoylglutathione lyase family enzyme